MQLRRHGMAIALGALLALGLSGSAQAISISLATAPPTPESIEVGDDIFLVVHISGLTAGDAPSISAFDFDLSFDDDALDFIDLVFESVAGVNLCQPETFTISCGVFAEFTASTGLVNFAEASLFSPADINLNQPAFGDLVTIQFQATAIAASLDFVLDVQDLFGPVSGTTEGPLTATVNDLSLSIVPEPSTLSLVMLGLAALRMRTGRRH